MSALPKIPTSAKNSLPSGSPTGSAEEALDCACGLSLNDRTARTSNPRPLNGEEH
jgi:hypothetical protein